MMGMGKPFIGLGKQDILVVETLQSLATYNCDFEKNYIFHDLTVQQLIACGVSSMKMS